MFLLLLFLAAFMPAGAMERASYSIEILVGGVPLEEYAARGTNYVEALEGREYSIRLQNRTGRRIAVALSVDGLNTIDAKTTSTGAASKWILAPRETITLDGWQTGSSTARRFFFTSEENSYGAWLGKTRNLGIISAAVFREKRRPVSIQRSRRSSSLGNKRAREDSAAPAEAEAGSRARPESRDSDSRERAESEFSDEHAATGIGREVDRRVRRVRFEAEESPATVMEIRYEYRDALVRLGVLPWDYAYQEDTLDRRERARGFEDTGFAPDPFRRRR